MAMADLKKQGRSWLVSAGLLAVGAVVGYALPQDTASPMSEVGTVTSVSPVSGSQTEITFKPKAGTSQIFRLDAASIPWQVKRSGGWNFKGGPPCLALDSAKPGKITLGVVKVHPVGSAPGAMFIAWVECYS